MMCLPKKKRFSVYNVYSVDSCTSYFIIVTTFFVENRGLIGWNINFYMNKFNQLGN
jgi:hypothetical protein